MQWCFLPTPILHTREGGGPKILKFWSEIAPCGQTPVYDPSPAPPLSPVFWGVGKGTAFFSEYHFIVLQKKINKIKNEVANSSMYLQHTKFCDLGSGFTSHPHSTY